MTSGTGVDRAALDAAIERGIACGGWCPKGGWAEDLPNPPGLLALYAGLRETADVEPRQRTEWNVRDSDATIVFSIKERLTGGTRLTFEVARRLGKLVLHLSRDEADAAVAAANLRAFLDEQQVRTLNVAGPRVSQEPEIGAFVRAVLAAAIGTGDQQSSSEYLSS